MRFAPKRLLGGVLGAFLYASLGVLAQNAYLGAVQGRFKLSIRDALYRCIRAFNTAGFLQHFVTQLKPSHSISRRVDYP